MPAPPQPHEFEVTLIGPHVGESVVLHYRGKWFLIDSCIDRASGQPAALVYLNSLGISPQQVQLLACTHWHDDHFRGLSKLYQSYPDAEFWLSGALRKAEFFQAVEAWRGWPSGAEPHTSGLEELTKCFDLARQRDRPPNFAHHDQRLWLADDGSGELWALSPSPATVMKGHVDVSKLFPQMWALKNALRESAPNHIAVAMHFRAGPHTVILGSDLEEEGDPQTGWTAILSSTKKPPQRASLYKVSHHGSATGHHDRLWTDLLHLGPVSVLTPFTRSRLPRETDMERLRGLSSRVYVTSRMARAEVKRRGAVQKMTAGKKLSIVSGLAGVVRCRIDTSDPAANWSVEMEGSAERLK